MNTQSLEFVQKTKQELNCKIIRTMLNYALEKAGPDAERKLIERMGLTREYLQNENNWVSFDVYTHACEAMKTIFNDDHIMYRVGIYSFSNLENFGAIAKMAVYLLKPESIYRRTAEVANQAVKFGTYRVVEIESNRLLLEFKNREGYKFHQHNCDYRLGVFAGIPQLFGLPIARHRSIQCVSDGADRCLYEFRWLSRTWEIFGRHARIGLVMGILFALVLTVLNRFTFSHFSQPALLISGAAVLYLIGIILDMKHTAQYSAFINSGKSDEIEEAMAFANQKYQEAADNITKLQAIIEGNAVLQSKLIKSELVEIVLEIIKHNLGYDRAMILFKNNTQPLLDSPKLIGNLSPEMEQALLNYKINLTDETAINTRVFYSGESALITDMSDVKNSTEMKAVQLSGTKSFVILPFKIGSRVVGTLTVDKISSPKIMTREDVRILNTLLNMLSVALENAELYQDLEARVRERTAQLNETNKKLESAYDELKQAQAQLLHNEKMASLGKLVAGIAHEMNNPAGILSGYIELMELHANRLRKDLEILDQFSAAHEDIAGTIQHIEKNILEITDSIEPCKRSVWRIKSIIQDLRNFSRLDENELMPANINEGLENTLKFFKSQAEGRIRIITHFNPIPQVTCFPGHLNQVFSNVISNAIEAIDGAGTIEVHTSKSEPTSDLPTDHIVVKIKDSGHGIPAEIQGKIFDPFFTTKDIGAGKGLGLSIAYGIIKQHSGSISAESEQDQGACITIRIPIEYGYERKG